MYLKILFLFIIFNFVFLKILSAQNNYSVFYRQAIENEPVETILKDSTILFHDYKYKTTFFSPDTSYWLKIKYNNNTELNDVIISLGTPITVIESYAFDRYNNFKKTEAGIGVNFGNHAIISGDKNKIYINFRVKNNTVYLKIKNNLLFKYNIDNIKIVPVKNWILKKEKQHLFQGLFIGITIILIFIGLLYKISSNRYINYYYTGYLFSNLVFFAFLNEYTAQFIFPFNYRLDLCLMVAMHFASLFYIQFARHYFNIRSGLFTLDLIVKYYVKISIIIIWCFLVLSYFDFAIYSYVAIILETFNQLITLLIAVFVFRKTDIIGKLIITGSFISSFDIGYMLYKNHIVELTTKEVTLYQTGYLIEILFILVAIRLRFSQVEKEQQNTLIKNLTLENENKIKEQENLLLKQEKDIAVLKNQLMQNELNTKDKEIAVNTMQITQKDLLLNTLQDKLKRLQPDLKGTSRKEFNDIMLELNTRDKNNFWNEFEIYFEQMHNGFLSKLVTKYPDLTRGEKRLCAFLKVGMTSKEIGNITQKSFKSIEVLRVRLRKKLGLEKQDNLTDFLNNI